MLKQEIITLKAANVQISDTEHKATLENEDLKRANHQMAAEMDRMRNQIRVQEDAILQAQGLKEHTDRLIVDYEQVKQDLALYVRKSEEVGSELQTSLFRRQKAEDERDQARRDLEEFKIRA